MLSQILEYTVSRTGEPAKNSSYDTHLYKLCDEAGIKRFCMHALRHTSIKTTMDRYVHVTDESLAKAVQQFEAATLIIEKRV